MKVILLSAVCFFLAMNSFHAQDQATYSTTTINKNSNDGKMTIEIITSDETGIQRLVDSLMAVHGKADIKINVIKVPGIGNDFPANWLEFEGSEQDLEKLLEMSDHMKWMGFEDLEDLRELQMLGEDKPFLGVIIDTDVKIEKGIRIMNIVENSAAEEAGLQKEDILLSIEDMDINSLDDLVVALTSHEIGDEIEIGYTREGKSNTAQATLKSRSESNYDLAKSFPLKTPSCCSGGVECQHHSNKVYKAFVHKQKPKLGVNVEDLDAEMVRDLRVPSDEGVLVTKVYPESTASKMGLRINDVILSLNKEKIGGVSSLHEALGKHKLGDEIEITYHRYGVEKSAKGVLFEFNHHSALDQKIFFED